MWSVRDAQGRGRTGLRLGRTSRNVPSDRGDLDPEAWPGWVLPRTDSPGGAGWSSVSTLRAGPIADVDAAGAITPRGRPLTVDFWIGSGDRWWHPSSETTVRQRRVEGLPIIETRTRVGGADFVSTCWADESGDDGARVVVELSNETAEPVVVAVVVRPFTRGAKVGEIGDLRVVDRIVVADGRPVVILPGRAGDVVVGSRELGDVVARLGDRLIGDTSVSAGDGSATLAAMLPLTPRASRTVQIVEGRERASVDPAPLDSIVSGWRSHLARGSDLSLPGWPEHLAAGLKAGMLGGGPDPADVDARVARVVALVESRFTAEAGELLGALLDDSLGGSIGRDGWHLVALATARYALLAGEAGPLRGREDMFAAMAGHSITSGCSEALRDDLAAALGIVAGQDAAADVVRLGLSAPAAATLRDEALLGVPLRPTDLALVAPRAPVDIESIALTLRCRPDLQQQTLASLRRLAGGSWGWRMGADGDSDHARALLLIAMARASIGWMREAVDLAPGSAGPWLGRPVDVARAPTPFGPMSYAIRWHGERPALLWELEPRRAIAAGFAITASAVDSSFRATDPVGEVLLASPTGSPEVG